MRMPNIAGKHNNGTGNNQPRISRGAGNSAELPLAGLKILVVDDDYSSLEVLACALEISGAETGQASSVAEALAAINDEPPDVLISDIAMPMQNGYDLIRQIRNHQMESVRNIPALAITAYAGPERGNVMLAGFQDLIPKPVDLDYLVLRISRLVSGPNSIPS